MIFAAIGHKTAPKVETASFFHQIGSTMRERSSKARPQVRDAFLGKIEQYTKDNSKTIRHTAQELSK